MFNTMNPVRPNPYQLPDGNGYGGQNNHENQGNPQQQTVARGRADEMMQQQQAPVRQYQPMPQYNNNAQYQSYGMQNPIQAQPAKQQLPKSNKINIAQILKDFNNTVKAIGTPPELCEKVNDFLFAVGSQVKKEHPAVNMIQSNLRSAAKVLDAYISETLEKESKVVENWLDALFLQKIDYHYNEDDVNKDFLVKFPGENQQPQRPMGMRPEQPQQPQPQAPVRQPMPEPMGMQPQQYAPQGNYEPIQEYHQPQPMAAQPQMMPQQTPMQPVQMQGVQPMPEQFAPQPMQAQPQYIEQEPQYIEQPQQAYVQPQPRPQAKPQPKIAPEKKAEPKPEVKRYTSNPVKIAIPKDKELKDLFIKAKKQLYTNNSKKAMDLFQKALERATEVKDKETESQICYEIGKIYDDNDCLVQALTSYNRSSQTTTDSNIKTKAHYSMAQIYDDVNQTTSAINHYFTTISYAGQTDNFVAQSNSLTKIANILTDNMDEQAFDYYEQATEIINQTDNAKAKGFVSSNMADAYNQFDEPEKALKCYRNAVKNYTDAKSSFDVAKNYKEAAEIMLDYNQDKKAKALLNRAKNYAERTENKELLEEIDNLLNN
ncbi:hypothetical protein IJI31_03135 [bacterium]|nr:hypothetical protein [bacterium]